MLDRTQAPNIAQAIEFDFNLDPLEIHELSSGLPIYTMNGGVQDVVSLDFVFPAGIYAQNLIGVPKVVGSQMRSGTSKKKSNELHKLFDYYGASFGVKVGNDLATLAVRSMSKHLPYLLPIIREILDDAQFPEEELDIYKKQAKQALEINLKKSEFQANRRIDEFLFGAEHPYGTCISAHHYDHITSDQLKAFQRSHYQIGKAKIFLAGKFSEDVLKSLEEHFGDVKLIEGNEQYSIEMKASSEKNIRIINDESGVQGAIRIGRKFLEKDHEDFIPFQFLNVLFGGYFGSRLMSNIREDKGYTYGIYSWLYNVKQEGAWMIATDTGRDVAEKAVDEIFYEMKRLREEPVGEEELLLVKNYILGSLLGQLDGPFKSMQRWKGLILNGFTKTRFDAAIKRYKEIQASEIQELAQKYLKEESFYNLIVV